MIENMAAVELYYLCQDQLIFAGMGEAVAVKHEALDIAMNWMRVENDERLDLSRKAIKISRTVLDLQRKDREENKDKDK